MIQSSEKRRDLQKGRVPDPMIEEASRASMAAVGVNSPGDGSASTTLVPTPAGVMAAKKSRFRQ